MGREVDTIYNRYGKPLIRLLNDGRFVDFKGSSLGFLEKSAVYSYTGKHVGWFEGGILRDVRGNCVGFGKKPDDYPRPILPIRQISSLASLPKLEPLRPVREILKLRPLKKFNWSELDLVALFGK